MLIVILVWRISFFRVVRVKNEGYRDNIFMQQFNIPVLIAGVTEFA